MNAHQARLATKEAITKRNVESSKWIVQKLDEAILDACKRGEWSASMDVTQQWPEAVHLARVEMLGRGFSVKEVTDERMFLEVDWKEGS